MDNTTIKVKCSKGCFRFPINTLRYKTLLEEIGTGGELSYTDETDRCLIISDETLQGAIAYGAKVIIFDEIEVSGRVVAPPVRKVLVRNHPPSSQVVMKRHTALGALIAQGYVDMQENIKALNLCNDNVEEAKKLLGTPTGAKLQMLQQAGFLDIAANLRALQEARGDVERAVETLLLHK